MDDFLVLIASKVMKAAFGKGRSGAIWWLFVYLRDDEVLQF